VVSSFASHDVDPGKLTKPGARLLAEYLEYARAGGVPVAASGSGTGSRSAFEADVAARLASLGITLVPQYGVGGYRVDFAAAHPDDPSQMILAVEADGAGYRDSGSVRDRDRLRKEHLERLGWRVHRLWSTSWFSDPEAELAKLQAAYTEAVRANPPAPPPPLDDSAFQPGDLEPPPDDSQPRPAESVPDRTAVTAPGSEAPRTRAPAALAREVSPASNGSPALDTRRTPIALPAGDPVPARGLPTANG
jgi:very-short-patch-repair endonuclease